MRRILLAFLYLGTSVLACAEAAPVAHAAMPTAAEIAAAQSFGQEDDISVISVTRAPVREPALA